MNSEDIPSIELAPDSEARLAKFARENGRSVENALLFLLSEGVKHLSSEASPDPLAGNGEGTREEGAPADRGQAPGQEIQV